MKNLENFLNMNLAGVENIKKLVQKSIGNQQNFEHFHEFLANFDWKRLILIKKVRLLCWNFENF